MNSTEITSDSCKGSGGEPIQITETNSTTQESAMIDEIMWPFMTDHGMHTSGTNGKDDNQAGGDIGTRDQFAGSDSCEGGEKYSQEEIDSDGESLLTTENNDLRSNHDPGCEIEVRPTTQLKQNTYFVTDIEIKNHMNGPAIYKVVADSSFTVDPSMGRIPENGSSVICVTADFNEGLDLESTVCPEVVTVLLTEEINPELTGDEFKAFWEELETKHADKIERYSVNVVNDGRLCEGSTSVEHVNVNDTVRPEPELMWKSVGSLVIAIIAILVVEIACYYFDQLF